MKILLTLILVLQLSSIAFAGSFNPSATFDVDFHKNANASMNLNSIPAPSSNPANQVSTGESSTGGNNSGLPAAFDSAADQTFSLDPLRLEQQNDILNANTDDGSSLAEHLVIRIVNMLMKLIGSIAMLLIVIAGVMMVTSAGNENQRSRATEMLQGSIIALVVAFSSYIIVSFVQGLFY